MDRRAFLASAAALSACASTGGAGTQPLTLYRNAKLWSRAATQSTDGALVVRGDRVVGVGGEADMRLLAGAGARVVDLDGGFLMPGFIDNHVHFITGGHALVSVDLRDAATPAEFTRRIAEFAARQPAGRWVRQGNWDHELWGGALPERGWIDAATPNNPVFVVRLDGHMGLANSLALERAGVTAATADPAGGEIVRDAAGNPTGVLKDTAMDLIVRAIPAYSDAEIDAAIDAASAHALSLGLTEVHHVCEMGVDDLTAFRRARARDALRLRTAVYSPIDARQRLASMIASEGRGDDWLRWDGVKGFVDGSLGSTTAWFYEPYTDAPHTSGLVIQNPDELQAWMIEADAARLKLAIHGIGDRANDWLLSAFEAVVAANGGSIRDRRFRIEHAQHLSAAAIPRFAQLGVIPSMQPYHAVDDGRWALGRIGRDRCSRTYAFRSLIDARARLTFGSDWPVAPLSPLLGVEAAVTRATIDGANPGGWFPEQKVSVDEALHCYTAGNAYAGFSEARVGSLAEGQLADFVVLDADPRTVAPDAIAEIGVRRTVIAGAAAFEG